MAQAGSSSPRKSSTLQLFLHSHLTSNLHADLNAEKLNELWDLVLEDTVALEKWVLVAQRILPKQREGFVNIKSLHRQRKYGEAVLLTLQLWHACGTSKSDLPAALEKLNLNHLAGNLTQLGN